MPDMLVKLYDLPPAEPAIAHCRQIGVNIRRPMPYEKTHLLELIRREFQIGWADETSAAFTRQPVSCFIATEKGRALGFAAHDCTARGFFGPTGVLPAYRGQGIGKALLLASLHALAELGFAYAVIGQAGDEARHFYAKAVGATIIPDSDPGIYRDWLDPSQLGPNRPT